MADERPEPFVSVQRQDDGVAIVRLDRPKMNALSRALLGQLLEAAHQLKEDPPGAVVIWGGDRIFAAGADIAEFGGPDEARSITALFHQALDAVADIPRPTLAAITGYALGGGCELALACDLRVAAEDAKLGQPEILLGIIPGGGGTQRLARLVGPARAKDIMYTGRQVGAEEALRIGLVDRIVPKAEVLDAAVDLAAQLARGPSQALALVKQAVDGGLDGGLQDGLALERRLFEEVFGTQDARIGVESFLTHGPGKATFTGG